MIYTSFIVADKEYKLRLSIQNTILLEKAIGCNPTAIFGDGETMPSITILASVIHYSMLQLQHGINLVDTYGIIDAWMNEGHTQMELIPIIIDIYRNSGLLPKESNESKN